MAGIILLFSSTNHRVLCPLIAYLTSKKDCRLHSDREKAASGASNACGHFVGNHAILRTFRVKYLVFFELGKKKKR